MPTNTTRAALPYPVETDPYADGNEAIQGLAQRLDGSVGTKVSVPYSSAAGLTSFGMSAASNATVAVTFPTSRFTQVPIVLANPSNAGSSVFFVSVVSVSATGCSITIRHYQETAVTVTGFWVGWLATQMTSAAAPGLRDAEPPTHDVVCRTAGCENAGVPIPMVLTYTDDVTGDVLSVDAVMCGVCAQPITELEAHDAATP